MKIAINTRLLLKNQLEGIGWYTYETLKRIAHNHPEHEFFFIFDRDYSHDFLFSDNITAIKIGPPTRHPLLWWFWFEHQIPKKLKEINADIFLSTDGFLSLKTYIPSIVVMHDLNFEHNPERLKWSHSWYYRKFFKQYAQKAKKVITVSAFSKNDISETYNINPNKIEVSHNGVDDFFQPISDQEKNSVKKEYSQGSDYILILGAINPRKNIQNQLIAFNNFKLNNKSNHKLLIVGKKMKWDDSAQQLLDSLRYKEDIIFTGHLNKEKIKNIYGAASCLLFASYFEGFGIPIIEAQKCACPVITSHCSSMPEVAGDAALLVNPNSTDEIEDAIKQIVNNTELSASLIKKGLSHSKQFSWDNTADVLWSAIESVLKKC